MCIRDRDSSEPQPVGDAEVDGKLLDRVAQSWSIRMTDVDDALGTRMGRQVCKGHTGVGAVEVAPLLLARSEVDGLTRHECVCNLRKQPVRVVEWAVRGED